MPPLTSQWLLLLALGMGSAASAQEPALFKNADLKLGQRLIAENKCAECHARKWADDGNAIYRPKGRINTPALLQGMVEIARCVICIRDCEWPSREHDVEEVAVEKLKEMVHVRDEDIAALDQFVVAQETAHREIDGTAK